MQKTVPLLIVVSLVSMVSSVGEVIVAALFAAVSSASRVEQFWHALAAPDSHSAVPHFSAIIHPLC